MKQYFILFSFFTLSLYSKELNLEPTLIGTVEERGINIEEKGIKIETSNLGSIHESQPKSSSLSDLILKAKIAQGESRRELMNQLKLQLRTMNKEKRYEAMQKIQSSFGGKCQTEQSHQRGHQHKNRQHMHSKHQLQFRPMHNNMTPRRGHHR